MYLTGVQLDTILKNPYYSNPVTDCLVKYSVYRGRVNAHVYTLRCNITADFNEEHMIDLVLTHVMSRFPIGKQILGSISYDLLLVDPKSNPKSYYIWKANSNQTVLDTNGEILISLSHDNVFRFIQNAARVDIPSLNINFRNSNVVVERVLAIVFSFATV
jgi:hypothetical protein